MPVSKKPRRKKSNPPSAKGKSAIASLPDRRAMEGFMSVIGGRRAEDATAEAQNVLASCLMKRGDAEALKQLLEQYDEDGSAPWLYTRALVAFREHAAGDKKAEEFAKRACRRNKHVPAVLVGAKKAKPSMNGYVAMGGEDEAAHYVGEWGFDWLTTPGAVDWLTKIAAEIASTTTGPRSTH